MKAVRLPQNARTPVDLDKNIRQRAEGNNNFIRTAGILFIVGPSKKLTIPGEDASIAPNDSGGPIVDRDSGKIIAVAATSTVKKSSEY